MTEFKRCFHSEVVLLSAIAAEQKGNQLQANYLLDRAVGLEALERTAAGLSGFSITFKGAMKL